MFAMCVEGDEERRLWATDQTLRGSGFSRGALEAISAASQLSRPKAMLEAVGGQDFHWPWFEEWHQRFSEEKKWPSFPAWSWFEEGPYQVKTVRETLGEMSVSSMKLLAKEAGVDLVGARLADDVRKALARKVKWNQISHVAADINAGMAHRHAQKQLEAKCQILAATVMYRAHNLFRHGQIAELLANFACGKSPIKRKVRLEPDDNPISRRLAKGFVFDPEDGSNLPPFFPGDRTGLRTA